MGLTPSNLINQNHFVKCHALNEFDTCHFVGFLNYLFFHLAFSYVFNFLKLKSHILNKSLYMLCSHCIKIDNK